MSNVFNWIGQREQRDILMQARKHMDQVVKVVKLLQEAVTALTQNDLEKTQQIHAQLSATEHEADILRRDLLGRLTQGLLLPPDRQDLVQLISRMDDIADHAQGASRILVIFKEAPSLLADDLVMFATTLVDAVDSLATALHQAAEGNATRSLESCTKVETIEEEADRLKACVLEKLFSSDLPTGTLLLMHELVESMENTADRAEDSADLIRMLTVIQSR